MHVFISRKSKIPYAILRLDDLFLAFYTEVCDLLSFLRCPKRTHSVLLKCKDQLLSAIKFEHDSINSDKFCVLLPLVFMGK